MPIDWSKYGVEEKKSEGINWDKYTQKSDPISPQGMNNAQNFLKGDSVERFTKNNFKPISSRAPIYKGERLLPFTPGIKPEDVKDKKVRKEIAKHKPFQGTKKSLADRAMKNASDFTINAIDEAALGIPEALTGDNGINSTAGKVGNVAGTLAGFGKAYQLTKGLANTAIKKGLGNQIERELATVGIHSPRAARELVRGGIAGGSFSTAQQLADAALDTQKDGSQTFGERVRKVGLDTALGGVGDAALPLIGTGAKKILSKYRPSQTSTLALPEGRGTQRIDAAQQRSIVPSGDNPITVPHTFKLNEASPETVTKTRNIQSTWDDLNTIDNEIKTQENNYQKAVIDQYNFLKKSMKDRGGVEQGSLIRDQEGVVTGRVGRISNNPQWYREIFAENGRAPSNKELFQLAKKHVDEGFQDEGFSIPSWKAENNYDETIQALSGVRDQIRSTLRNEGLNLTDAQLKTKELSFNPESKSAAGRQTTRQEVSLPQQEATSNVSLSQEGSGLLSKYAAERQAIQQEATLPRQEIQQPIQQPRAQVVPIRSTTPPQGKQERGFITTLKESSKPPETFKERLSGAFKRKSNEETVRIANERVANDIEEAASFVMGKSYLTPEKIATAHRLIDEFNKQRNFQRAVDIAEKISEGGTKLGQSVQAFSIFNRLTPEGVLVHAQRIAQRVNEKLPITAKEVKVTSEMAAQITDLAKTTQRMTGVNDLSNNVIDILERAKSGQVLNDSEKQTLLQFVNESRQFVKETTKKPRPPRPPQIPKDKRVRDNVVSFLDAQEQAAKEWLRNNGFRVSSTPLDVWGRYAIIGAAKMGKGAIKFADWSEQMVKDLGEEIRPHLQNLYERSREAFEQSTKKISSQTISQAERLTEKVIKGKQLEGKEADSLRQLAQNVSGLSGEAKRLASQDLQVVLQTLDRPSTLRKVSAIQTMGQLLNPKTQVRNALGNELFYRVERLNKLIATPIDIARSKITGGQRTVTFRTNNQGQYWSNWMRGLKAGWKGANVNGLETQYDLGSPAFKGKWNPLTYFEKALGASLKSFDTAAYMRAYNNTIGEMATLKAINEGKRGNKEFIQDTIRNADENMKKIADEYGRYGTFQDKNAISQGLARFKRGLNLGKDFGVGDLIIKYPRTPGALLMRAIEYSPAGFARSFSIMARPWFKKEPDTAEVVQSLSRAIIGTLGLMGAGYFLMDKGILTGAASKDKDIRELQSSAGQGQYQVNLSALKRFIFSDFNPDTAKIKEGDLLYTYDWMQPISMAVSIGANTKKNFSEGKSSLSGTAGTVYNSLEGGLGTLTEQSVLQGLRRAAEGYPGQTVTDKIMDILSDVPASFVPTISNQTRQLTDNARRETYDPSKLQSSLNRAKNRIPGVASKLPQQSDTLGRSKEVFQDNSPFNVLLNPGFSSRYKLSTEAKLIVDLINETGDETLAPRAPQKSITIDGQRVKLSGEEFARLQQYQGEETRKRLEPINPGDKLNSKIKRVESALDKGGKAARERLKKEMIR